MIRLSYYYHIPVKNKFISVLKYVKVLQLKHRLEQRCKLHLAKLTKTDKKCFKLQLLIQYKLWIWYTTVYTSVVDVVHNSLHIRCGCDAQQCTHQSWMCYTTVYTSAVDVVHNSLHFSCGCGTVMCAIKQSAT